MPEFTLLYFCKINSIKFNKVRFCILLIVIGEDTANFEKTILILCGNISFLRGKHIMFMNAFLQSWRISETGVQTESRNVLLKCCSDTENTMFAID